MRGPSPRPRSLSAQAPEQPIDPADLARVAAEYKDKLLRVLAEMENLRRRTEREIADTRAYGISAFARDILAVADNCPGFIRARGVSGLQTVCGRSPKAQTES